MPVSNGHGWIVENGDIGIDWMDQLPAPLSVLEYLMCKCTGSCSGHVAMSSQGMQDHVGAKSANWLASWLAGQLCCQPRFQFYEVKAVKIISENCKRGCTPTFLPL